jgi:hypothetical protein
MLDDDFTNAKLNVNYSSNLRDLSWNIDGGFQYQKYNWYGLPQPYFDSSTANMLDVDHTFYGVHFGGEIDFHDALFKNVNMRFRRFGDDQKSGENRFVFNTEFDVPIQGETINTEVTLDYIGGSFDRNYYYEEELKYGNINVGRFDREFGSQFGLFKRYRSQ